MLKDLSSYSTPTQFWAAMARDKDVYLSDNQGNPIPASEIPSRIGDMHLDDPYRSLSEWVRDDYGCVRACVRRGCPTVQSLCAIQTPAASRPRHALTSTVGGVRCGRAARCLRYIKCTDDTASFPQCGGSDANPPFLEFIWVTATALPPLPPTCPRAHVG